jgi:hypothetical protein
MGDLLLELDPAEASADAASAQDALNASLAEAARSGYAIDAVWAGQALETRGERDGLSGKDAKDTDDASEAAELSPIEKLAGQPELTIAMGNRSESPVHRPVRSQEADEMAEDSKLNSTSPSRGELWSVRWGLRFSQGSFLSSHLASCPCCPLFLAPR